LADIHEANGARFIAANDMIVAWERKTGATFEPETTAWMFEKMAQREGAFVDVGAATGWFTIPMILRGYEAHSFEPNPAVAARLRDNAVLNNVELNLCEAAASVSKGDKVLFRNPRVPLTSGGSIEAATCSGPQRVTVRGVRIDDEVQGPVALIKIDVEGHELSVLSGARAIIEGQRPPLVLEANTDGHRDVLAAWIEARGYSWRMADTRNMLCEC